jgi:hypothetical protein
MGTANAQGHAGGDVAGEAIATVLRAEAQARDSIVQAQLEAARVAEGARTAARALAERSERRLRGIVAAFERRRATRVAEIDAEAAAIARPHVLSGEELRRLDAAVSALARELTGVPP